MHFLHRGMRFLLSRILAFTLVFALIVMSFYLAMNTANLWILIDEGMDARAGAILMGSGQEELTKYFREEFLAQDATLQVGLSELSPYRDYDIRGYAHRTQMRSIWAWPWEDTARAEIIERVPTISGSLKASRREALGISLSDPLINPPAWASGRYRVTLVRTAGRWKISNLQLIEQLPNETE